MGAKILMLAGLPGSGKSSESKRVMKEGGNYYRVNRDHLREMLYFSDYRGKREEMVTQLEKLIASDIIINQKANLIVDDCNLGKKHEDMWRGFAKSLEQFGTGPISFEKRFIDTPIEECIKRDSERERTVGRSVIMGMAMQYGLYKPQSVVLCDLDGTIANLDHRLHYVHPEGDKQKDWKSFFSEIVNDSPINEVINQLVVDQVNGAEIFFISARPENYRKETQIWLDLNLPLCLKNSTLFMRRAGDKREDSLIKSEILHRYFPNKAVISHVYDDRPRVIRMWREEGLEVVDCGNGKEF